MNLFKNLRFKIPSGSSWSNTIDSNTYSSMALGHDDDPVEELKT